MTMTPADPCVVCGHPASDSHHIRELEYGGAEAGQTVRLCKNHHTGHGGVHWWLDAVWDHRSKLSQLPEGNLHRLVEIGLDQRQLFQQTGVAPDARRRIVAELTVEEQQMVRLIKQHYNMNSIDTVLRSLIRREAALISAGRAPGMAV